MSVNVAGGPSVILGPRTGLAASIISSGGLPYTTGLIIDLNGDKAGALGSSVATWPDQSGNGNNATQAVMANQPIVAVGANGHLGVLFNGVSSQLTIPDLNLPQPDTFFIVASGSVTTQAVFFDSSGSGRQLLILEQSTGLAALFSGTNLLSGSTNYSNSYHIFEGTYSSGNGVLLVDGTPEISGATGSDGLGMLLLGMSGAGALLGTIQRILFYSTPPPTDKATLIRTYLKSLYGTP